MSLRKCNLTKKHVRIMQKFAGKTWKHSLVKNNKKTLKILGGDNAAEGVFSQGTAQLRRTNKLGRTSAAGASKAFLAAQFFCKPFAPFKLIIWTGLVLILMNSSTTKSLGRFSELAPKHTRVHGAERTQKLGLAYPIRKLLQCA